jgi:hypothetical protein
MQGERTERLPGESSANSENKKISKVGFLSIDSRACDATSAIGNAQLQVQVSIRGCAIQSEYP